MNLESPSAELVPVHSSYRHLESFRVAQLADEVPGRSIGQPLSSQS